MPVKKTVDDKNEIKPIKKKSYKVSSEVSTMKGYDVQPGDNAKYLNNSMYLMNLPEIDLHDVEQVKARINEYFDYMAQSDMKPTVAGLSMALNNMSRRTLIAIVNDYATGGSGYKTALPPEVALVIKKAHRIMEVLWENYVQNGKINPVMGIFLGKNNYGYQDKTEHVVTPNLQADSDYDADAIRRRYLIDYDNSDKEDE